MCSSNLLVLRYYHLRLVSERLWRSQVEAAMSQCGSTEASQQVEVYLCNCVTPFRAAPDGER